MPTATWPTAAAAAAPPPDASTAAAVLHELQRRYIRWRQRDFNYCRLLAFLSFIALLLAVLFLQRSSGTSYQARRAARPPPAPPAVHSTLAAGLAPQAAISSVDDVYAWLRSLLETAWRDPVCGDGVCEAPFEFASWGRFGCRADCGRLQDIQNLTAIQVDLAFDFHHPAGSIPATELMSQASWNLCPEGDSSGCYWGSDQAFDKLAGSTSVTVPDVPDGRWAVVIKRNMFSKVQGAVRVVPLLEQQAQAAKVGVALRAAAAAHASEGAALEAVVEAGSVGGAALLNATLHQLYEAGLAAADLQLQSGALDADGYAAEVVALQAQLEADLAELSSAEAWCPALPFFHPDPDALPPAPDTCDKFANLTVQAEELQLAGMASLVLARLLPASAAADAALAAGLAELQAQAPELHAVVAASTGQNASLPAAATAAALARFYEEPWLGAAKAALAARALSATGVTTAVVAARAQARLGELDAVQQLLAGLPEVQAAQRLTAPGGALPYTSASWDGGSRAYATCNLERQGAGGDARTPQYVGACVPRVPCSNSSVADSDGRVQVVYSCAASGVASPSAACGDLCDSQNICGELCQCSPACAADQVCQCDACLRVGSARSDPDFLAMQASAGLAAGALLESDEEEWGAEGGSRRLQQSDDGTLQAVLAALAELEDSQAALQQQVQALQTAVADAAAAAQDTSTQTLIASGQQKIAAGQAAIQGMLSEILGKQTAAAAASAAQAQALANLQSLRQQQLAAQVQLEQSAKDQADAIAIALQQDVLTASQALELYRRVRLQTLAASRAAVLASVPCTDATLAEYAFSVDNYPDVMVDTARVRYIGTSNRIIAGLLLFNKRGLPSACANSRFASIAGSCKRGVDTAPYGVDPVFKRGTSLYNPDLDSSQGVTQFYDCAALASPTYNLTMEGSPGLASSQTTNQPPYCAELFSPRSLPYGFHAAELKLFGPGFPVLFDINLDADAALRWLSFIQAREGLFLDSHTERLLAQVVAYNPELRLFSSAVVAFQFAKGGSVQVTQRIQTLRVELYATRLDAFRLALEVALTLYIAFWAVAELQGMYRVWRLTGSPLAYFASGWHAMDFVSTCLLVACCTMWWVLVWREALPFAIGLRFDVYADLGADARYLALADGGAGLRSMHAAFSRLQSLSDKLAWYAALTGINLLLLVWRLLQMMDFQPRLGVVTRSLAHAGPDLLHFGLVFGLVFVGYAMLAHLIFGNSIAGFSTFGSSVNTCFALLLGDTAVNGDLQALSGLQAVAGAAFFWTFEVLVFLVLLNFLLAIIVDAFTTVKERTTDTTGLHTELAQMLRHAYHSAASRFSADRISDAELSRLLRWWQDSERPPAADINGDGVVDTQEAALQDKARPKLLRVEGGAVTEEDLRRILQGYVLEEAQGGDLEASPGKPVRRLLSSLGLERQPQPSHKGTHQPLPDLGRVAHYVMQRFGEEEPAAAEGRGSASGDGSSRSSGSGAPPAAAPASPAQHGGDFLIAAHRKAGEAGGGGSPDRPAAAPAASPQAAEVAASSPASNGHRLAQAMHTELEQRRAADAGSSLLLVQGTLAAAQQRMLDSQQQLMAQHASVVQAIGSAASAMHAAGGGAADTGWGFAAAGSFRHRALLRSDSGRAPMALPPGRPPISSPVRQQRLSDSSEEEGR